LNSFRYVLKPDVNEDYKEMESTRLYQRYPKFLDKCKFETHEEKQFVIFMMCNKKHNLIKKYRQTLSQIEKDKKIPDDWE
jgi:hypothetical protein